MAPVKRVEVMIGALQLGRLTAALDEARAPGYTVLPNARGRGRRGVRAADELTDALKNVYVLIVCPPEDAERIIGAIRPVLKRAGGICLVTDAERVEP